MEIGSRLSTARQNQHLTQQSVADELHVSRQTISSWENGRSYPDIGSLIAISDLFELSLDQLLKEDAKMVDEMKAKEEAIKYARYVYWASVMMDVVLIGLLVLNAFMTTFKLANGAEMIILVVMIVNLFVLLITESRYRNLKGKPEWYSRKEWGWTVAILLIVVTLFNYGIWLKNGVGDYLIGSIVGSLMGSIIALVGLNWWFKRKRNSSKRNS